MSGRYIAHVRRKEADVDVILALLRSDSFDELSVAAVDYSESQSAITL